MDKLLSSARWDLGSLSAPNHSIVRKKIGGLVWWLLLASSAQSWPIQYNPNQQLNIWGTLSGWTSIISWGTVNYLITPDLQNVLEWTATIRPLSEWGNSIDDLSFDWINILTGETIQLSADFSNALDIGFSLFTFQDNRTWMQLSWYFDVESNYWEINAGWLIINLLPITAVPEPSQWALLITWLLLLGITRKKVWIKELEILAKKYWFNISTK